MHGYNKFSGHCRVECMMYFNVNYVSGNSGANERNSEPAWGKLTVEQIDNYIIVLGNLLIDIDIPHEATVCHKQDTCAYHDAIIMTMIQAWSETVKQIISKSGCSNVKAVHGWNAYNIEGYFRTSLFWYSLWIDNGKPRHGIVADLRHKTRAQYHRLCKMVLRKMLKLGMIKWLRHLSATPLVNHYISKLMYSVVRKLITLTGLTMLRVKVKFLICLQNKFQNLYNYFLFKKKKRTYMLF